MARARRTSIEKALDPRTDATWVAPPSLTAGMMFRDVGSTGLRQYGGWVREEFLHSLQGRQAQRVYREMGDNSPVVGSVLFAVIQVMRKVDWRDISASDSPEAKAGAHFAWTLRSDMSSTWEDHIVEALSMLQFGFAPCEIVYKRRQGSKGTPYRSSDASSLYDDGLIGIRRLPLRGQETVYKWFFDENGQVTGLTQQPWMGSLIDIPMEKLLLYRPSAHKNNPEGHALDPETMIPTVNGWCKLDDIRAGDRVFDDRGESTTVVARAEWINRPCYAVKFSDGFEIIADAEHLWKAYAFDYRTQPEAQIFSTKELANIVARRGPKGAKISIDRAGPVQYTVEDLPLDPYFLGLWLSDGYSGGSAIAVGDRDRAEVAELIHGCGYTPTLPSGSGHKVGVLGNGKRDPNGPTAVLKRLGLLNNKHVPIAYLRGSVEQRKSLLAGLMDGDGSTGSGQGCYFGTASLDMAVSVAELVRSLGCPANVTLKSNREYSLGTAPFWYVTFSPSWAPFRFIRKKSKVESIKYNRRRVNERHYIKSITQVENRRTVCIEVDSSSHLFLAGEGMVPTHNSILRTAYRPWYFMKRIEELEAILFERMGGLPVVRVPNALLEAARAGDENAVASLEMYKKLATNIRVDEQMGVVMPSDVYKDQNGSPSSQRMYDFELKTPDTSALRVDPDQVVRRYAVDILKSVLADFIDLGHQARGTQSLSISKIDLFYTSIRGWLQSVSGVINRHLYPRVWELNAFSADTIPRTVPDLPMRVDLDVLGGFVSALARAGMPMFPDADLENYIRSAAGMPQLNQGESFDPNNTLTEDTENLLGASGDKPGSADDVAKYLLGMAALVRRREVKAGERPPAVGKLSRDELDRMARVASPAMIEAGNYPKGYFRLHGMDVSIETPRGVNREGTSADGRAWRWPMPAHYGYVRRTKLGADGEAIDAYVGPTPDSRSVWVIDQLDAETGKFDEHKAFLGYGSLNEVLQTYRSAFGDGKAEARIGAVHRSTIDDFKSWVRGDSTTVPLGGLVAKQRATE